MNKNYLVNFNNCTVQIENTQFENSEKIFKQHFLLNHNIDIDIVNVNKSLNLEEINLKQIKNIEEIEEVKFVHKKNGLIIYIIIFILSLFISICTIMYFFKR